MKKRTRARSTSISIGIVTEAGASYYAISSEFDESKADSWVKENVIAKLETQRTPRYLIRDHILEFVQDQLEVGEKPEFWAYFADYDWVVFCWLLHGEMRVLRHRRGQPCPRCGKATFCDDCAFCETCRFTPPEVDLTQPPPPAPMRACPECGGTASHTRTCSITRRAAAS